MSIMEIKQVGYSYDNKKKVLKGVNAEMEQGKLYAILGPSGCGKTTLLSLIGGLDSPGSGQIYFDGQDIAKTGLSDHRKNHVAFIFQAYNLIDYLTPAENVIVTPEHFMLVAIVGGILLVAAVLVSSISTMRLKPKQILSQME